ncbi:hypothetical protein HGH92_31470 [Chitinophaga varians]|uniref:Uncharacterized protein n=1 Tax=Chitinophaga varians TaxID=2202339 RepID=A0A847S0B6_9BACT|nr:hypothetical protein [Chitinophaga varians]NLR68863.1 hypothetical protein [Chitinophaga varians]
MNKITFNTAAFLKTVIFFLILTVLWTVICHSMSDPFGSGPVFLTGLGFLVLFPVSIYAGIGRKKLQALVTSLIATIVVFAVASFIILPLTTLITNATILYAVISSCFVAIAMTLVFDRCYGVRFRYFTIGLTFVALLLAYYLFSQYRDATDLPFGIHPRLMMFNVFQGLMLVPLLLGIVTGSTEQA